MTHEKFYSKSYFYDVAFSFKDITNENQTLLDIYHEINGRAPISFLDIAAGPANNAREMSERGLEVFALDQSKEMAEYAKNKTIKTGTKLTYLTGDMRDFTLPTQVDLATIFMASTGYLLTNEDMVQHLKTVSKNLNLHGIYVLEMVHPRDVLCKGTSTSSKWEETDGDTKVSVEWGNEKDPYDPVTQTRIITARLKYETPNGSGEIVQLSPIREYTFQEMKALIELSGTLALKKSLGEWDRSIPLSNEPAAWRMILVLQKIIS